MASEVVGLDVIHLGGLLDAWHLPHVTAISHDIRVLTYLSCVALEVDDINLVESN